ncbi:hypothetical protein F53441_3109 [Fusarium austroafricanum]|uniref:Restriction of telomere capping protein 4 n=1 Tax=Fusarium austroafricanum TaxID=2364996 RepID=A0A8H4PB30_9HYPO|nr:hypothetical protein F53441_3109 [Fusarium austroafricanum]
MAARVGMSKLQKPPRLLSMIGSKEQQKLEQQPEDVNAPPMSSEDEAEDEMPSPANFRLKRGSKNKTPVEQSDDSEPGPSTRANMKRTHFAGSSTDRTRNATRKVNQVAKTSEEDTRETSSSSAKRRKLDNKSRAGSTTQFETKEGFVKKTASKKKYGGSSKPGSSQPSRGSQVSRSSQSSQTKKGKANDSKHEIIRKNPEIDDFLHSSQTEEKSTFKPVSQESFSSPTQPTVALRPGPKDDLGTPKKGGKVETSFLTREPSASPTKRLKARTVKLSQENARSKSSSQRWSGVWKFPKKEKPKDQPSTPEYEPATFVAPADIDDLDGSKSNAGSISSPVLSDLDQLSDTETIDETLPEDKEVFEYSMTKCPWCGDLVSEQALKEYSKGKRLNVQMQTRFCAKHKKETAMETWRERGYPHIDWDRLEGRLDDHRAYLIKIVDGKPSFFRDMLADKIETGQARSLKKEGNLNPGYYGPRGCKLMCDYLVEEFGESLKEKATKDRVIAGRGSAAFIQSVLVAELAVQLIMEDMDVSASEAREIMDESKAMGELIHEEI